MLASPPDPHSPLQTVIDRVLSGLANFPTIRGMHDFDVQRCTRRCAKSDRELRPGETYYSALVPNGSAWQRLDYSAEAWEQPPEGAVAWWKSQMPSLGANRPHWAPNDALLQYFQALEQTPDKAELRYVLALLLVRRRLIRWEHTETNTEQGEVMVLYSPREEREYRVPVQRPSRQREAEIQDELAQLLVVPAAA